MKRTTFLLTMLLLGLLPRGWAQSDGSLIVLDARGKIKYYAPDEKPVNVISGLVIDSEGTLKMKKDARIKVLRGMKPAVIEQPGKFAIQDALPEASSGMKLGFSTDFYNMIKKTIADAGSPPGALVGRKGLGGDDPPPTTTSGKKGAGGEDIPPPTSTSGKKGAGGEDVPPPTSTSGKKGAGGEDAPPPTSTSGKKGMGYGTPMLKWNFPLKGKLNPSDQPIFFSWEGYVEGEGPWMFSVAEKGGNEPLFTQETADQYLSLTAIQMRLALGKTYVWRVSHASTPGMTLRAFEFTPVQEHVEEGILDALLLEEDYQKAGAVEKLLWEAYAYEQAQFFNKADALYQEAVSLDPDSWLAVQLYRGFWGRNW